MGILSRFKDIMASNFNALLDKCEDPEKMIDQYLRNLSKDLGEVKAETAAIMASEKAVQRELNECLENSNKMGEYAKKALAAGSEADARQFLAKKSGMAENIAVLEQQLVIAKANSTKMKQMHDKLSDDVNALNERRDTLKAKIKLTEAQTKINELGASAVGAKSNLGAFDRMEAKINRMADEAEAMAELNQGDADPIEDLTSKYDTMPDETDVDDELAKLKAEMGM